MFYTLPTIYVLQRQIQTAINALDMSKICFCTKTYYDMNYETYEYSLDRDLTEPNRLRHTMFRIFVI